MNNILNYNENKFLKTVLESAQDGIIILDSNEKIIFWNNSAKNIFGYTFDEIANKNIGQLLLLDNYNKNNTLIKVFKNIGKTIELLAIHKNGNEIYIELSLSEINFKNEDITLVIARNITEKKLKQLKTLELKEIYQTIFDANVDGIIVYDLVKEKFVKANSAICKMFGYSEKELLNMSIKDMHPKESLDIVFKEIESKQRNNGFFSKDLPCLRKDGSIFYANIGDCKLIYNNNQCLVGFFRDVTKRKTIEEQLLQTKGNYEHIFYNAKDGLVTSDKNYNIIRVNPSLVKWTGIEEKELIGKPFNHFFTCNCKYNPKNPICDQKENCPLITIEKEELPVRAYITNKINNSITYVTVSALSIKGMSTSEEVYLSFIVNINKLKEMEDIKENFVATLSHDLRVPLLAENHTLKYFIKGTYGNLSERQKDAANTMLGSNQDLINLVNNLLEVYKYESQSLELYKTEVSLNHLINECIKELSPLTENTNKTITCHIDESIPIIFLDKKEIKRVLVNLIGNSIAYTSNDGTITIEANKLEDCVLVKITDNGPGIPEDELDKIFDKYFTSSKKFRKVGTGLGLYVCKQKIQAHGGKIGVESKLNERTSFYFTLPFK